MFVTDGLSGFEISLMRMPCKAIRSAITPARGDQDFTWDNE
jgi:hypothetical protein